MKKPLIVYAFVGGGLVVLLLLLMIPRGGEKAADGLQRTDSLRRHRLMQGKLVVAGSTLMAPLVSKIAERFCALNPGAEIEVTPSSSDEGLKQLQGGAVHIALVARELLGKEKKLHAAILARDGIAFVINSQNPVRELTLAQAGQALTGRLQNWTQVGGNDIPVRVVCVARRRAVFIQCVNALGLAPHQVKRDEVAGTHLEVLDKLSNSPAAIAFVSLGLAARQVEMKNLPVRLLSLGGCSAETSKVRTGEYPLIYPMNFVTQGTPENLAKSFIEFAQSKPMRTVVNENYFSPPAR